MHGVYKLHTIASVQHIDPLLLGARLTLLSEETFLALTTAAFLLLLLCWCPPPPLCVALSLMSLSPLLLLLSDAVLSLCGLRSRSGSEQTSLSCEEAPTRAVHTFLCKSHNKIS